MDLSFSFFLIASLSILLTGISKSGFGGGLGVMSVPLMSLHVAPQFAAAVMMPILLAIDVLVVWRHRRTWKREIVLGMLPAAAVGLAIGSATFQHLNADLLRLIVGMLATFFVLQFMLSSWAKPRPTRTSKIVVWGMGIVSGFASFVAHAGGPPIKGYLLKKDLEKTWFVGTNTVFFFSLNFIKTIAYGASGTLSSASLSASLILAPMLFLGVFLGTRLHRVLDQTTFIQVVYGFLALTAIKLVSDGVNAFL